VPERFSGAADECSRRGFGACICTLKGNRSMSQSVLPNLSPASRRCFLRTATAGAGALAMIGLLAACGAAAPGTAAATGGVTGAPTTGASATSSAAVTTTAPATTSAASTAAVSTTGAVTKAAKEVATTSSATATSASSAKAASVIPAGGNKLIYGYTTDIKIMNPFLSTDTYSALIDSFIFEGLVKADPDTGAPLPSLAEKWDISPDGLTYTFHIRPGVKWSDGQPFTADDAKFTFDTILDPKTQTVRKSLYSNVKSFTVVDPMTLQVTLKQVYCPFLIGSMTMRLVPKHILGTSPDINKDDFNTKRPVGTGPYTFVEWLNGDHVTLQANPNYWNGAPKIGQFIYKVVPSGTVLAEQLKTGEVDLGIIDPSDLAGMQKQANVTVLSNDALGYEYIGYNQARPLFQDKLVRQALTYAINRQAIVDKILFGQGSVLNAPVPAKAWAYNPAVANLYPYDPNKAKALLKQAGWSVGTDGILAKGGQKLAFTSIFSSNSTPVTQLMTIAQQEWKAIGVDCTLKAMDFDALLNVVNKTRAYDTVTLGWSLGLDPDQTSIWSSDQIKSGFNFISYNNPQIDALLKQGISIPGCSQDARKAIYAKFQQIIADDEPYTFAYSGKTLTAVSKRIQGAHITSFNTYTLGDNIKDWSISG
jgi:peptide/nickel transport system substrate-binding protein